MPSPVGHTLFGLIIYVVWSKSLRLWLNQWKIILWIIFCANLPDFDLFIGLIVGDLGRFHQAFTHTLGFVLIITAVTFIFLKIRKSKNIYSISILTFIAVFSNSLLDVFTNDSNPPVGVQLFWPFSDYYFNCNAIFLPIPHSRLSDIFSPMFIHAVLREIILLFIPLVVLIWLKMSRSKEVNSG